MLLAARRHSALLLQVNVHSPEQPKLAAWRGGSLAASAPDFPARVLTREVWTRQRQAALAEFD